MFHRDAEVFVLLGSDGEDRLLYQAIVTQVDGNRVVVRMVEPIVPQVGDTAFLHCEVNRKFMQQSAKVQALMQDEQPAVVAFECFNQPISAENRMSYRVSVAAADLKATLDSETKCPVVDVSATGFGIVCDEQFKLGQTLDVAIHHDGCTYTGEARVQSVKHRPDGSNRYGLHAIEAKRGLAKTALQNGLSYISASVQRQQLKRLARA